MSLDRFLLPSVRDFTSFPISPNKSLLKRPSRLSTKLVCSFHQPGISNPAQYQDTDNFWRQIVTTNRTSRSEQTPPFFKTQLNNLSLSEYTKQWLQPTAISAVAASGSDRLWLPSLSCTSASRPRLHTRNIPPTRQVHTKKKIAWFRELNSLAK